MSLSNKASNEIFNHIASRYDLVNTVLSFGLHRSWHSRLTAVLPCNTHSVLDLACGTLSIPLALLQDRKDIINIVGIDISDEMLQIGKKSLSRSMSNDQVQLIKGDALTPPFKLSSFDAVTIGFALRNVPDIMKLISSTYRILKPAGFFGILEFSRPKSIVLSLIYCGYLKLMLPIIGFLFTGNFSAYQHLGDSIVAFPGKKRFIKMLQQAGFKGINSYTLAFGAVTLYTARK